MAEGKAQLRGHSPHLSVTQDTRAHPAGARSAAAQTPDRSTAWAMRLDAA